MNVLRDASLGFALVLQDLRDDLLGAKLLFLSPIQSPLRSSSLDDDSIEGLRGRGDEGKMRWWWEQRRWAGNKDDGPGTKTMGGAGTKMMEGRNKDDGLGIKTINKPGIKMIGTMVKKTK